jgi:hypothetical protein
VWLKTACMVFSLHRVLTGFLECKLCEIAKYIWLTHTGLVLKGSIPICRIVICHLCNTDIQDCYLCRIVMVCIKRQEQCTVMQVFVLWFANC